MENFKNYSKKIAIIGQGYVGLPLAKRLVDCGYFVVGIDTDSKKVELVQRLTSPVEDITDSDLADMFHSGRYTIDLNYDEINSANVIVICVPTPLDKSGAPDYSFLNSAVHEISSRVSPNTLIVNESTSSPGTLRDRVASVVFSSRRDLEGKLSFAVAPERINPGDKNSELGSVPRVVGALDEDALRKAHEFYKSFTKEVYLVSSPEVAELSKLLENTYRQVNISFINQFNHFCRAYGVDTREIIAAASTKPYGFQAFFPSAGIGGHCIPVDPQYLLESSRIIGQEMTLIAESARINMQMPRLILERIMSYTENFEHKRVLIIGLGYKPGLSDLRESPGIQLLEYIKQQKIEVEWFDSFHETWNNSKRCVQFDSFEVAIVCMSDAGISVRELIEGGTQVFDCTGELAQIAEVIQI